MELLFNITCITLLLFGLLILLFEYQIKKRDGLLGFSLLIVIILLLLCIKSSQYTYQSKQIKKENVDTLRAYNVNNGMIKAIYVDRDINVYHDGDTVWVNQNTNKIEPITMSTTFAVKDLVLYVIDEWDKDPHVRYMNSTTKWFENLEKDK